MTSFVDANVWMFAVGRSHPLRERARDVIRGTERLVVSAEVLQELLHCYRRADRPRELDLAFELVDARAESLPLEPDDVRLARDLTVVHPGLAARDLVHLAFCHRRGVERLVTFDRALAAAAS